MDQGLHHNLAVVGSSLSLSMHDILSYVDMQIIISLSPSFSTEIAYIDTLFFLVSFASSELGFLPTPCNAENVDISSSFLRTRLYNPPPRKLFLECLTRPFDEEEQEARHVRGCLIECCLCKL